LKYQQLYTASTKVLQAGNQMFSTLLSIMNWGDSNDRSI
jgi:flagellar hook-associated protein FlgK